MATTSMSQAKSGRMYSWWWDSHISPKNSKWLQENLTDMDAKVKSMIKLIEEDADSFARRAEMYYKKRPELMKLVEEFYRAYRALAERYDNATGVLRQAHRTMAEAFPNQVPQLLGDDSPASSVSQADPRTPETSTPIRTLFDHHDSQRDASLNSVKGNGEPPEESDSSTSRKQLNNSFSSGDHGKFAEGKVRKGLNFRDKDEAGKFEEEITILKEKLSKLESEKEAGLIQYSQSLDRLSNLEAEVSRAQEDSRGFNERASKAEAEVQNLKAALAKLEVEREASLLQYQQCLERISNLETVVSRAQNDSGELNERASKAETEAQVLKQELSKVIAEKDSALDQYIQSLGMISNLEKKLLLAEEDARKINERAEKSESEVENLKEALVKLTEEKENAALQYQQCLETISSLESKISSAQEEAQRLNGELETVVLKVGSQTQELTEKQNELGRLWTCIQEERFRFVEAETAFQALQHLHSQAQEELRSLAIELQNRAQILGNMETRNQSLHDEVLKVKEENKHLDELNLSSSMSIKDLQAEICSLRDTKGKLEEEVGLRVDQRNALQQDIYCLKEELNELNNKHCDTVERFESSVKELQDENSVLNETCERERSEKVALLEKLVIMEQLLEKNALLENSLADLSAELEGVRGKLRTLEESFQSLLEEKSTLVTEKATLVTHLQVATENLEKLSEKNTFLKNSLFDAHDELEGLRVKSKGLEDLCQILDNEKSGLINQKDTLASQLNITREQLEELGKSYTEFEEKYSGLEKEKNSAFCRLEELQFCFDAAKHEHASFTQLSETRLADMETQIRLLQEESWHWKREFDEELDKSMGSQIEIFVLQKCIKDLEEKNFSLSIECQKLSEASEYSEKLISELKEENLEQEVELESFFDQTNKIERGLYQLLNVLNIDVAPRLDGKNQQGQTYLNHILDKLEEARIRAYRAQDENSKLAVQISVLITLLGQLGLEAENLNMERNSLNQEFTMRTEQFLLLQRDAHELHDLNEALRLKVRDGDQKEEVLAIQIENLSGKLLDLQAAHQNLQEENSKVLEQKRSLMKDSLDLEEKNCTLEEESCVLFGEKLFLSSLSLIFENFVNEKSAELKEVGEDVEKLRGINGAFEEKLRITERKLDEVETGNFNLREMVNNLEDELKPVASVNERLSHEIVNLKDLLVQKETELSEAEQKLIFTENKKSELLKVVEDLKREYDEVVVIRENQEKQISELSEENGHLSEENGCLCEANWKLEVEVHRLREENGKGKNREENLSSELQKGKNEIDLWETEALALFGELQFSYVFQALFDEKIHAIIEAYKSLEDRHTEKDNDIILLKEKVGSLEGENGGLKAQLDAYVPIVMSLRDCISSLESHSRLRSKLQTIDNEGAKDSEITSNLHVKSSPSESQITVVPDAFSDLQDFQTRVKSIEKAVIEMERIAIQENLDTNAKLEAVMRQIEELKSKNSPQNANSASEISEAENGLLTKDIMLDQVSECSSYGIARRDCVENENQMLELWETVNQKGSIDLTVGKPKKSRNPTSEKLVDKELAVDKLEISKRSSKTRHEENKRKVLERLNSDIQKLTNLRITVQDLKRKVETTEKSKKGKANVECEDLKGQLEEAEEGISKLFDLNGKLMKNTEDSSFSSEVNFEIESEEKEDVRRRKISEQARRVSEKIGRLQLEIQKIQFILLKLDDEKESKGKTGNPEMKRRVLLKDYLYGVGRTGHRRKKGHFCSCVQFPTKGD